MQSPESSPASIEAAAAQWLARLDRELTAAEQDAYLQWLREHPAHGAELARLKASWSRLDRLRDWHPSHSAQPNADLLAPPSRRKWLLPAFTLAAACVLFAGVCWIQFRPAPHRDHNVIVHPGAQRLALEDGSFVELNGDAKVDVKFTRETRAVQLLRGEAHFTVAKDVTRPFVVSADDFSVRAVGTAFSVQMKPEALSVLVTEGKVQLDEQPSNADPRTLSPVLAGQRALVWAAAHAGGKPAVEIHSVTPAELERALAWQTLRLEFVDLPLRRVITEFNRFNGRQLVIADDATGQIVVGGSFRADNLDAFVRLLDLGFGVASETRDNAILLRRR